MRRRFLSLFIVLLVSCMHPKATPTQPTPAPADELASLETLISTDLNHLGMPALDTFESSLTPGESPTSGLSQDPTAVFNTTPTNPTSDTPKNAAPINPAEPDATTAAEKTRGGYLQGRHATREYKKAEENQCQKTCELVDNICDAAERICQITARLPNEADAPKRCERAKNACSQAQSKGQSCGCE